MSRRTLARASTGRRPRLRLGTVALHALLLIGALMMLFPVLWMAASSFKTEAEITAYPPRLLPAKPSLKAITNAWTEIRLGRYFVNSLLLVLVGTPLALLTSSSAGFVLGKYRFRGRDAIFYLILATMMIPGAILLIPHYQVVLWAGILNSYWALILPGMYRPFGIFLMRQAMHGVPDELLQAARIDGASEPRIYFQIVLPLIKSTLAAFGILVSLNTWNDLLWPLVVLSTERLFTLAVGLASFAGEYERNYASRNAGAFITIFPVVLLFLFFQRHIVQGVALTGMKG